MREFIPEVQAVIDKWRKTISEGGEFIEAEVRREIIRAGGYKLGVGETDRAMRAIKEPSKMEDRIREIAGEEAREALGVTPEVTKLTADIWNRMTPIEKDRLWVEAKLSTEEMGRRWIELWPEEKRALIRVFKKEQLAIPKAPIIPERHSGKSV